MNFWKVHVNLAPHPHTDPAQPQKYVGKHSVHPSPPQPIGGSAPRPSTQTKEQVNNLTKAERDGPAGYEQAAHTANTNRNE